MDVGKAMLVGKWAVGQSAKMDMTVLRFEFADSKPLNLGIAPEEAEKIAEAIIAQARQRRGKAN